MLKYRRDFIKKLTNDEIKKIVSETCFINLEDKMNVDLLNEYVNIVHKDIAELTDNEINEVREFSNDYLSNDFQWKDYHPKIFIINDLSVNLVLNSLFHFIVSSVFVLIELPHCRNYIFYCIINKT